MPTQNGLTKTQCNARPFTCGRAHFNSQCTQPQPFANAMTRKFIAITAWLIAYADIIGAASHAGQWEAVVYGLLGFTAMAVAAVASLEVAND